MTKLKTLLSQYYTDYYKKTLGLKDYQRRVKERLKEKDVKSYYSATREIKLIKQIINYSFKGKRILVVGAGTGLELFQLKTLGAKVYGLEPENRAIKILNMKSKLYSLDSKFIRKGVAEHLPYTTGKFDFIYCWQVLEHVQNLEKSIKEMVRVTKKGGWLFFGCPDYRQIIEPHYKMYLPLFLPKFVAKLILIISGRNPAFLNSLQFVTSQKIRKIFTANNILAAKVIKPYQKLNDLKFMGRVVRWIQDYLEIEQSQLWLAKKI